MYDALNELLKKTRRVGRAFQSKREGEPLTISLKCSLNFRQQTCILSINPGT